MGSKKEHWAAAEAAAERGTDALHHIADRITPMVHDAGQMLVPLALDARDRIVPLVEEAREKLTPLVVQAKDRIVPLAMDAKGRVVPLAHEAADRVTPVAHELFDRMGPLTSAAVDRTVEFASLARKQVGPIVDEAVDRFEHDVLPRAKDFVHEVMDSPQVAEAQERGAATVAALRGDLRVPVLAPRRRGRGLFKLVAASAILAGVVVAIRSFLGSKDDGWTAHEPSEPYIRAAQPDVVVVPDRSAEPDQTPDVSGPGEMIDEGGPAEHFAPESTAEDAAVTAPHFGEGSYVGSEPPDGYTIKGNLRSMKYHTPDAGSYDKTNADVWFTSEEAARSAGFSRAQR